MNAFTLGGLTRLETIRGRARCTLSTQSRRVCLVATAQVVTLGGDAKRTDQHLQSRSHARNPIEGTLSPTPPPLSPLAGFVLFYSSSFFSPSFSSVLVSDPAYLPALTNWSSPLFLVLEVSSWVDTPYNPVRYATSPHLRISSFQLPCSSWLRGLHSL